jgi:hypothetical protein
VTDVASGKPLLSGPTFPHEPPTFDGQGLPEAFKQLDGTMLVPGVGVITEEHDGTPAPGQPGDPGLRGRVVAERLVWAVEYTRDFGTADKGLRMEAVQEIGGGKSLRIAKTVTVEGATVRCGTEVELLPRGGAEPVALSWFAHPFFPLCADGRVCTFDFPTELVAPDNKDGSSFYYDGQGQLCMDHRYTCSTCRLSLSQG